jgi:ABC-2 type transport system permease protein
MKAFLMIMRRELLVRVRKRSFILLTLLGPIIFGLLSVVPAYLSMDKPSEKKIISVLSNDLEVYKDLTSDDQFTFSPVYADSLSLSAATLRLDRDPVQLNIHTSLNPTEINALKKITTILIYKKQLRAKGITDSTLLQAEVPMIIQSTPFPSHKDDNIAGGIGMISSVLIYLFIFMYGVQVLRAVMEEKQNRIVEILISSVKPFQLMAGKIAGIGLVSIIQFTVWILLAFSISSWVQQRFQLDRFNDDQIGHTLQQMPNQGDAMEIHQMVSAFNAIPFTTIITCFFLYFVFSYLLYASLFAAIGSMIDHESDQQSLTLPITAPLIITFVLATNIMQNPDSSLAFWLSIIPFTSPIAMMIRVPFGVPLYELVLSLTVLILTSVGAMYASGKIYRTGILMYGKKASWSEAWKWMRSK